MNNVVPEHPFTDRKADLRPYEDSDVIRMIYDAWPTTNRHRFEDSVVLGTLLPRPASVAAHSDLDSLFAAGADTCPGAYRVGEMLHATALNPSWAAKLSDAYDRYVIDDLRTIFPRSPGARGSTSPPVDAARASEFVRAALNFAGRDGSPLRNALSNLEERAASQNALKIFLLGSDTLSRPLLDNPLHKFNRRANEAARRAWRRYEKEFSGSDSPTLLRLLRANALLNSLRPDHDVFRDAGVPSVSSLTAFIGNRLQASNEHSFSSALGSDDYALELLPNM